LSSVEKNIRHAGNKPTFRVAGFQDQPELSVQLGAKLGLFSLCAVRSLARGFCVLLGAFVSNSGQGSSAFGLEPRALRLLLC
jgi:hypothetical protein